MSLFIALSSLKQQQTYFFSNVTTFQLSKLSNLYLKSFIFLILKRCILRKLHIYWELNKLAVNIIDIEL